MEPSVIAEYTGDEEYMECVKDILDSSVFHSLDKYIQHGTTTCKDHSIQVSYLAYKLCKRFGGNWRSAARAGHRRLADGPACSGSGSPGAACGTLLQKRTAEFLPPSWLCGGGYRAALCAGRAAGGKIKGLRSREEKQGGVPPTLR